MEIQKQDINLLVETLRRNDYSAADIHRVISTAWGDNIVSLRRVQQIAKEFKEGKRKSFERAEGSGREKTEERSEKVAAIRHDMEEDSKTTSREIALKYG